MKVHCDVKWKRRLKKGLNEGFERGETGEDIKREGGEMVGIKT